MTKYSADVLVAGHLCLDIIPTFNTTPQPLNELLSPGKLVEVANAVLSTGGATSNTGLALHRLGFNISIAAKIGDDHFGEIAANILKTHNPHLTQNMIVSKNENTSYTIVLNPPGIDRIFLHCPGANHTLTHNEVTDSAIQNARLLHFGYPPLMKKFFQNDGDELVHLFKRAHAANTATSLDMCRPDPESESGNVDWNQYLNNVLPHLDIFLPSIDEIIFMTDKPLFDKITAAAGNNNPASKLTLEQIRTLADKLLNKGPAIIGFKLGDEGFYLKTTKDKGRLQNLGKVTPRTPEQWVDKEILTGCRKVKVAGTTGAGDCTIAGFLGGILRCDSADEAVAMAVCTGGASVEARDSTSGVPAWETVRSRLAAGWPTQQCGLLPEDWEPTPFGNYCPK